ncbi:MAG: hypothetical protein B7X02_02990, partial [Rhodospirillales bacterium 12-54-5]
DSEKNSVYRFALKLVTKQGLPKEVKDIEDAEVLTAFLKDYLPYEAEALLYAAALTLVGLEEENKKPFADENMAKLMVKAMEELNMGKKRISARNAMRNFDSGRN